MGEFTWQMAAKSASLTLQEVPDRRISTEGVQAAPVPQLFRATKDKIARTNPAPGTARPMNRDVKI